MDMDIRPMVLISLLAGSLSTMNLWVARPDHARFHLNDTYMVLLMTAWMVLFDSIYYHRSQIILIGSAVSIVILIYCIRNQSFITDTQFMKGMIPHHSMAITMSEKIKEKSKDKNIIELANNIIRTQNEEIAYMKNLGY